MTKPLAIDLFCGLGGWTDGLLAEGYDVIGFDIERHVYGNDKYPAQLVLQDVLTLHGEQFKNADLIVASPPCQEYSYMAMPWSKAKEIRRQYLSGERAIADLTALFDACFRIQKEAIEAAGYHIPMVVENVRGAQEWVGRSRWNFGSFHLWGDVPALMPSASGALKAGVTHRSDGSTNFHQGKYGVKAPGLNWSDPEKRGQDFTRRAAQELEGKKQGGDWFSVAGSISRTTGSKSKARKAASARIAKIPLILSQHIAHVYKPMRCGAAA